MCKGKTSLNILYKGIFLKLKRTSSFLWQVFKVKVIVVILGEQWCVKKDKKQMSCTKSHVFCIFLQMMQCCRCRWNTEPMFQCNL